MRHLTPIYILMLVCLCACRFEFDVRNNAEPGIYLQAIVEDNTLNMRVKYVSPLGVDVDRMPDLDGTPMTFRVEHPGGTEILHGPYDADPDNVALWDASALSCGQSVTVSAMVEGMSAVQASASLPRTSGLAGVSLHREKMIPVTLNVFDFELDRQPEEGSYVGLMIRRVTDTLNVGTGLHREDIYLTPTLAAATDPTVELCQVDYMREHSILLDDYPEAYPDLRDEGRKRPTKKYTLTIIPAAAFRDGKLSLPVMNITMPPRPGSKPSDQGDTPFEPELSVSYEFTLAGVDENFYRYCLARYKSKSDYLAMMGLAPAQFAWSNVTGGFGVCGAICFSQAQTYNEEEILKF